MGIGTREFDRSGGDMRVSLFLSDAARRHDAQSGRSMRWAGLAAMPNTGPHSLWQLFLDIDWDETTKQHQLKCQLLTADGDPVVAGPQWAAVDPLEAAAEAGPRPAQSTAPRFACRSPSTFLRKFLETRNLPSGRVEV